MNMSNDVKKLVAGVDIGSDCIKAIALDGDRTILGRSVVQAKGYYQDRFQEALAAAADEAQAQPSDLAQVCVTGFGSGIARAWTTMTARESDCHARGAFHRIASAMSVVDIGARVPKVIAVDGAGRWVGTRAVRKCAAGIGFLMDFAARHLDVHPTRLMELAAAAEKPAAIGSYCTVFAGSEILEQLRDGATREEIALGCMHSVAERVLEIGSLTEPVVITGGVAEYFPGVVAALEEKTGLDIQVVSEPIYAGALGAALKALEAG